jgi:hypothetical protein
MEPIEAQSRYKYCDILETEKISPYDHTHKSPPAERGHVAEVRGSGKVHQPLDITWVAICLCAAPSFPCRLLAPASASWAACDSDCSLVRRPPSSELVKRHSD